MPLVAFGVYEFDAPRALRFGLLRDRTHDRFVPICWIAGTTMMSPGPLTGGTA